MGLLHTCPCTGKVIEIPLPQAVYISDNEVERLCLYEGGSHISDPWYDSYLEASGVIQQRKFKGCSLDDIEEYYDEEDEEEDNMDTDISLSGWENE